MTLVVLDTDVTSRVIKGTVPDSLAAKLVGKQLTITFVTIGELSRWTVLRELGERRRAKVEQWITRTSLGGDQEVARKWGQITAYAQLRGRPQPYDDSWVAACCLAYELPLATLNVKHFKDYAEHEGLTIITASILTPDSGERSWQA
jgi:predicted nucleic acid-binding protein